MAKILVVKNGVVLDLDEDSARVLADIVITDNPGAKTVVSAVNMAGGASYLETVAAGNMDDVFEITTTGKENKRPVKKVGTCNRAILVKRLELALSADSWQTTVVKTFEDGESEEPATTSTWKMAVI